MLDGFPRNLAQAEALDPCSASIGRALDAILFFDVPDEVAHERAARPRTAGGPPRRHARRDREAARDLPLRDGADRRALPLDRQARAACTPTARSTRCASRSRPIAAGGPVIIRKSRAGDRDDGTRRCGSSPRRSRCSHELARARASRWSSSTASATNTSTARRRPTSKGYKGFPAAICISPNSMIVHGIPGAYRAQEGDLDLLRHRRHLRGADRRLGGHLRVGEISAEAQRLLEVCQEALASRHRGRPARTRPSATSRGGADGRRGRRLLGRSGASSGTASAALPRGPAGAELRLPYRGPELRRA